MNSSVFSFGRLMVSLLATMTPLGCGPADPDASYSPEDEAVGDDSAAEEEEKVVTFEFSSGNGFAAITDDELLTWGRSSGDKKLTAEIMVYLCLPTDTWVDIWVGDETIPHPACSTTPCYGVVIQNTAVDDTEHTCMEVVPLLPAE